MVADDPDDPRVGSELDGRYRLLERLAEGGMGVVYRAERIQLGRAVAIKFLHDSFAGHADFTKRFEREALTMSQLDHPNCVSVIDFGIAGSPYIVMEFVTGKTLGQLLDEGPISAARAINIARQILAGVAHAHTHGIIHRDIKPANIMLSDATGTGDHVRILDFGLAKLRDADSSISGIVIGTPSYLSPEQAACKPVDGRADVYSAGVVLFELLTSKKPFVADNMYALIRKHREQAPPSLASRRPKQRFSAELEAVVRRALAKSPDDRFADPVAFMDALAAVPEVTGRTKKKRPRSKPVPVEPLGATVAVPQPPPAPPPVAEPPAPAPVAKPPAPRPATGRVAHTPKRGVPGWLKLAVVVGVLGAGAWFLLGRPKSVSEAKKRSDRVIKRVEKAVEPEDETTKQPPPAATLEDVRALIARGDREAALRGLHELRRHQPQSAEVPFLLGNLYWAKGWRTESLVAYGQAVKNDASYATRPKLVDNVLHALARTDTHARARVLVITQLGRAALPFLQRAAAHADDPVLRRRAAALIAEVRARRPPAKN